MGMSSAQTVEIDEQDVALAQETVHGDDNAVRTLIDSLPDRLAESRPVDIRISIPLGFDRFFISISAGPERRRGMRRLRDRLYYPLFTLGNALFMGMTTIICVVSAILGLIAISSVVQF
jgi:hypothetical protein